MPRLPTETVPLSEFRRFFHTRMPGAFGLYEGPGIEIPPRKEECSCACSETDELGRPRFIGRCGAMCERRPR
jgi:hypothetical protein